MARSKKDRRVIFSVNGRQLRPGEGDEDGERMISKSKNTSFKDGNNNEKNKGYGLLTLEDICLTVNKIALSSSRFPQGGLSHPVLQDETSSQPKSTQKWPSFKRGGNGLYNLLHPKHRLAYLEKSQNALKSQGVVNVAHIKKLWPIQTDFSSKSQNGGDCSKKKKPNENVRQISTLEEEKFGESGEDIKITPSTGKYAGNNNVNAVNDDGGLSEEVRNESNCILDFNDTEEFSCGGNSSLADDKGLQNDKHECENSHASHAKFRHSKPDKGFSKAKMPKVINLNQRQGVLIGDVIDNRKSRDQQSVNVTVPRKKHMTKPVMIGTIGIRKNGLGVGIH